MEGHRMDKYTPGSLLAYLADVPDPRSPHGRQHPLPAILGLVCCAILCGARGDTAIAPWAHDHDLAWMHRLGFTRRPPKRHGIRQVLLALDVAAFERAVTRWADHVLGAASASDEPPPVAFALDGKTLRGSFAGLQKAAHLLSVVSHRSGLTLAQTAVPHGGDDKTNEHKTALHLLDGLVLGGRLLTGDAMFCQRDLSQHVLDGGGHYLWFVKANQPTLLRDIQAAFDPRATGAFSPPAAATLG
jgi:hypothetical protein